MTTELARRYLVADAPHAPELEGFFEGTARGEVRLPRCLECLRYHWYPLRRCPHCGGEWAYGRVGPEARLFSWGVIRHAFHPSLEGRLGDIVALVTPVDAPQVRLVTNLVGIAAADLAPGLLLRATFVPITPRWTALLYEPATGA